MQPDSNELQRLSRNWIAITWQLGDRERQLRRSLVSLEETLGEVMQRALMEACVMGFLNKKIAFTEPEEFGSQWQVFVFRDGAETSLPLDQRVSTLELSAEERLIFRPQSVSPESGSSLDDSPIHTGLPQSFVGAPPARSSNLITYVLIFALLVLIGLVALLLLR